MAGPYFLPVKNQAFLFAVSLQDQANPGRFKANPTLAVGDVQVDIDGAGFNNLGTLPTVSPAGSKGVAVTLAAGEMNGDVIKVLFSDQTSPPEWADQMFVIQTSGVTVPGDVQTIKTQAVTCAGAVTVLASVGTAGTDTAQTGDSYARLGAPAGASIAADLAEIAAETDGIAAIPTNPYTGTPPTTAQIATAVLTTQMSESYPALHVAPTLAQALFVTMQKLVERSIAGVTETIKKVDGATTAYTETLNDATTPTSVTRAS